MISQLDLFQHVRSRRNNPETSHAAAARVNEFAANHHAVIVLALKDHGPMTVHEISAKCGIDAHAVGKRMNELEQLGAAKVLWANGSMLTKPGPSGRQARVWRAV